MEDGNGIVVEALLDDVLDFSMLRIPSTKGCGCSRARAPKIGRLPSTGGW